MSFRAEQPIAPPLSFRAEQPKAAESRNLLRLKQRNVPIPRRAQSPCKPFCILPSSPYYSKTQTPLRGRFMRSESLHILMPLGLRIATMSVGALREERPVEGRYPQSRGEAVTLCRKLWCSVFVWYRYMLDVHQRITCGTARADTACPVISC